MPAPGRDGDDRNGGEDDEDNKDPGEQPRYLVHADTAAGQDQEEDGPGKTSEDALHGSCRGADPPPFRGFRYVHRAIAAIRPSAHGQWTDGPGAGNLSHDDRSEGRGAGI